MKTAIVCLVFAAVFIYVNAMPAEDNAKSGTEAEQTQTKTGTESSLSERNANPLAQGFEFITSVVTGIDQTGKNIWRTFGSG